MFNSDNLTDLLANVKQFRQIPKQGLRDFIQAGKIQAYPANASVFLEEAPCAGLFVLLAGQVQLCRHGLDGKVSILAVVDPVIMFNEVAALDLGPNPVTAIASQESTLWHIDPEALRAFLLSHPLICFELLHILASRNRHLVAQFQDLSFRSVQARAAKLLLELSDRGSQPVDRRLHPNHQLAARIATVPEAFSRSLKSLREAGALQVSSRVIEVRDLARLEQLAQVGFI